LFSLVSKWHGKYPGQLSPAKLLSPGQKWQFAEYALQYAYEALDGMNSRSPPKGPAPGQRRPLVVSGSSNSGNVAILAAMRRASSRLRSFVAETALWLQKSIRHLRHEWHHPAPIVPSAT
jgi:hypothetical protein